MVSSVILRNQIKAQSCATRQLVCRQLVIENLCCARFNLVKIGPTKNQSDIRILKQLLSYSVCYASGGNARATSKIVLSTSVATDIFDRMRLT